MDGDVPDEWGGYRSNLPLGMRGSGEWSESVDLLYLLIFRNPVHTYTHPCMRTAHYKKCAFHRSGNAGSFGMSNRNAHRDTGLAYFSRTLRKFGLNVVRRAGHVTVYFSLPYPPFYFDFSESFKNMRERLLQWIRIRNYPLRISGFSFRATTLKKKGKYSSKLFWVVQTHPLTSVDSFHRADATLQG